MYWIFAVFALAMVVFLFCSRFPRVELTVDEQAGSLQTYGSLFRKPIVWAFFLCVSRSLAPNRHKHPFIGYLGQVYIQ